MFDSIIYERRRQALRNKVQSGIILLLGNNEAPANYPDNCYKYRQDSSFLYFFGQSHPGYAGVLDIEAGEDIFFGNDVDTASGIKYHADLYRYMPLLVRNVDCIIVVRIDKRRRFLLYKLALFVAQHDNIRHAEQVLYYHALYHALIHGYSAEIVPYYY